MLLAAVLFHVVILNVMVAMQIGLGPIIVISACQEAIHRTCPSITLLVFYALLGFTNRMARQRNVYNAQ